MLQNYPALVLNADFRPLSLFPLSTKSVEEVVKNVYEDTVTVIAEYDRVIRSPSMAMRLPSVIALRQYVRPNTRVPFTDKHVLLRDRYLCQYCGEEHRDLTFDHVIPASKGGETNWTNIVTACDPCNARKGDRTDIYPMKVPREPTQAELLALSRAVSPKFIHPSWVEWLPAAA